VLQVRISKPDRGKIFSFFFPPKPFIGDLGPTQPPVKQVKLFMPASKAVVA
jgi:hypothetical protein